jgi:hypothetical protein
MKAIGLAMVVACFALAGGAWAVDWDGDTNTSWDEDTNWVGDAKPTSSEDAHWDFLLTGVTVSLDANQVCDSLSIYKGNASSATELIIDDATYGLTLSSGDITFTQYGGRTATLDLSVPVTLGDSLAVWDLGNAAHQLKVRDSVTETVAGTTIESSGLSATARLYLYAPLDISGSLWIRTGELRVYPGSDLINGGSPAHNIILGDTSGDQDTIIYMNPGDIVTADIVVQSGSTGTRTIESGHSWSGGGYAGDFLLNADVTLGTYHMTCSGDWSGSGGVIRDANYNSGLTGALSYSGDTSVLQGGMAISGTTSGMGNFLIQANFYCGVTLDLAAGKIFEVDGGTLYPGDPGVTGTHKGLTDKVGALTINGDLLLQDDATVVFQLDDDTTAGTDYDTIVLQDKDLTLDGTFNIVEQGGFDGVDGDYLLIDYGAGTLSDNEVVVTFSSFAGDYWVDTRTAGEVWLRTGELEPAAAGGAVIVIN